MTIAHLYELTIDDLYHLTLADLMNGYYHNRTRDRGGRSR